MAGVSFAAEIDTAPSRVIFLPGPMWMNATIACGRYRPLYDGPPCGACIGCLLFEFAGGFSCEPEERPRIVYIDPVYEGIEEFYYVHALHERHKSRYEYGIGAPLLKDSDGGFWRLLGTGMVELTEASDSLNLDVPAYHKAEKFFKERYGKIDWHAREVAARCDVDLGRSEPEWLPSLVEEEEPFLWRLLRVAEGWRTRVFSEAVVTDICEFVAAELLFDAYAETYAAGLSDPVAKRDSILLNPSAAQRHVSGVGYGEPLDDWIEEQFGETFVLSTRSRSVSRAVVLAACDAVARQRRRHQREYLLKHGAPYDVDDPDFDYSRNVYDDGDSECDRFVVTGSNGKWGDDRGDCRSTPIYSRCGVAFEGDSYITLSTYRCEKHGISTVSL